MVPAAILDYGNAVRWQSHESRVALRDAVRVLTIRRECQKQARAALEAVVRETVTRAEKVARGTR